LNIRQPTGYAADGYARIKGISALITTFGVGELSAINAIAGAYSEMVPVIHIVGTPSTSAQADGKLLHHTLGNGDFTVFANMARYVSCASVNLRDPHEVAAQIDDVIKECYIQSRPVYIFLPMDVVHQVVDGEKLKTPVNLKFKDNEAEKEDHVVKLVLDQLYAAKNPVILVDACASRHRVSYFSIPPRI
jgi:pyruvate decarboxylase